MNAFNPDDGSKLKSGFTIPDGYFDGLEDKVMQRLPKPEHKVLPLFARYRKTVYAAAAILVLSLAVPIYNSVSKPSENIDEVVLEHYLTYESGISQLDLISAMDQADIENIQAQFELPVPDEALEEEILINNDLEHIITE